MLLPSGRVRWSLAVCALVVLVPFAPRASAYSGESLGAPADGARVSSDITFYIRADGHPEGIELYRIEVARDKKFESIVTTFDMKDNKAGWSLGDLHSLKDVPEEYRPRNFEGIHYRAFRKLGAGTYFWRAAKSVNNGPYEPISGIEDFLVDTAAPDGVETVRLRLLEDGRLQVSWQSVTTDEHGESDIVSGFRVYRYQKVLKRFPMMTRYLVAETEDTQLTLPGRGDSSRISYYLVNAVDAVGNEAGRRHPAPIGTYAVAFNPPDLERLVDPKYLKQLADEQR